MDRKTLLTSSQHPRLIALSVLLGVGLLIGSLQPVQAQTSPRPLEDLQTKDGSDFFNGRGNGQNSSIMNFIQNAIIGTPRSSEEFASEQQGNLDDAAAKFRQQRADLLRKQQIQTQPTSPTDTPSLEIKSGN